MCFLSCFFYFDLDNPLSLHMVDRIADIISQHLLCLKFICPYIDCLLHFSGSPSPRPAGSKSHSFAALRGLSLPDQILSWTIRHLRIPTDLMSAEFFYHLVHLIGLIDDDVTVKFHALRIIMDPFFQSFCITLDQCNWRLQLMGYISDKFFPALFLFFPSVQYLFAIQSLRSLTGRLSAPVFPTFG